MCQLAEAGWFQEMADLLRNHRGMTGQEYDRILAIDVCDMEGFERGGCREHCDFGDESFFLRR